jgi:hypothetical protein
MAWKCGSLVRKHLHSILSPSHRATSKPSKPQNDSASIPNSKHGGGGPPGKIAPHPPHLDLPVGFGSQFSFRHEMAVESNDIVDVNDAASFNTAMFANDLKSYSFNLDALRKWMITL